MKNKTTRFEYSNAASSFISKRIDEDSDYSEATEVFEYIIKRHKKAGFEVAKWQPLAPRCFVVKTPRLRDLAFFYIYAVRGNSTLIFVVAVEFAPP